MSTMHHCIPCKTVSIKCNTPWINQEIRSSIRKRRSLFYWFKHSKCYDWLVKYRSLRNSIVNQIHKAKKEFFVKLANSRSDPKAFFWPTIRKLQPRSSSPSVFSNLTFGRYASYGFPANFFCVLISLFYPFSLACFFHATPLLTKSLSSHFASLSLTHLLTFSLAPPLAPPLAHAISHFSTHFISICILHAYSNSELPLFSVSFITSYLTIHRPKSDTCKSCDSFKTKIASEDNPTLKNQYTAEWELHKRKAERVYQQLRKDAAASKASPTTGVIDMLTFDLQQTLPTPSITTNVFLRYILKY